MLPARERRGEVLFCRPELISTFASLHFVRHVHKQLGERRMKALIKYCVFAMVTLAASSGCALAQVATGALGAPVNEDLTRLGDGFFFH